ncbi:MAG: shikimate dehydrogenase [Pseudorhodoplanes sp.]|nr:Shikimate dehydrogenase (NADP(+)) [Pseudorhodoplanes sp.]MBW7948940.1 shikimate dehydrogenase [Pseudorhodoplanes sp.]MCL4710658.1 shikimate dehydrogenase [Pseudorhodoplanes sp.]GIK81999.1 MAG: shikimate dehydrogenase (NADP(+)) [Alphaproteobacteria bacterium]
MTEDIRAACVIGWPVEHSRSPLIHNYWIGKYQVAGEYRREAVPPEEFDGFVKELAERGYAGANVTLPHKERVLGLSAPDERAQVVGAANTLWFDEGVLRATNTDVEGFLANLDAATPGWDRDLETALVLGAGGAARSVVFSLIARDIPAIRVVNRTPERAEALRERFGPKVRPAAWDELGGLMRSAGLLVNTTTLGMQGQPPLEIALDDLPASAVVCDLVYAPLLTDLIRKASTRGLRHADGLGMLLHQAVRGFSLWFGVTPEVTPELRALVEADLTKPA